MRGFVSLLFLLAIALLLSTVLTTPPHSTVLLDGATARHDDATKQQLLLNTHYFLSDQFKQHLHAGVRDPVSLATLLTGDLVSFWEKNRVHSLELLSPMDWKIIVTPVSETRFMAHAYYLPLKPVSFPMADSTVSISLPIGYVLFYDSS